MYIELDFFGTNIQKILITRTIIQLLMFFYFSERLSKALIRKFLRYFQQKRQEKRFNLVHYSHTVI